LLSKKFFKHLEKVRRHEDYQDALQAQVDDRVHLLVRPHHKTVYRLFLDNTTGEAASALRTALTAREKFKAMIIDQRVELTVGGENFTLTQ